MPRSTRWKLIYVVVIAAGGLAAFAIASLVEYDSTLLIGLALLFFIPGRINGHYWRSFYTGRKLMDAGDHERARQEFEQFLVKARERPGLKSMIWLVWAVYTRDVEAMTLNNIGAILMQQGNLDPAESKLAQAIELDAEYPIPYFNLAIIEECRGNRDAAARSLATAQELGYRNTSIDKVIAGAASILAYVEGRRTEAGNS